MLLAAATLLPGCTHSPGTQPPPDGVLTLNIDPAPVAVSNLVLQSARMQIEKLTVIGDTVPDGRSMLAEIVVDLLAAARSFSFGMLPQGVYSRVTF
ncbi:MAG TPA: hypothetical protein VF945_09260, partial [Polyangia bacterium]